MKKVTKLFGVIGLLLLIQFSLAAPMIAMAGQGTVTISFYKADGGNGGNGGDSGSGSSSPSGPSKKEDPRVVITDVTEVPLSGGSAGGIGDTILSALPKTGQGTQFSLFLLIVGMICLLLAQVVHRRRRN